MNKLNRIDDDGVVKRYAVLYIELPSESHRKTNHVVLL